MGDLIPFPAGGTAPNPYEAAVTRAGEIIDRAVIDIAAMGVPCGLEIVAGEAIAKLAQTSSPDHAVALAVSFGRRDG